MKVAFIPSDKTILIIYRTLLVIAALLAVILIGGTIYGLTMRGRLNPGQPIPEAAGGDNIFSGLRTMRIPTADLEPETLIISIAFPYDRSDRPFSDELASRLSWFEMAITQYFGAFTAEELAQLDIAAANTELLSRLNSGLRLGQIQELYILEFMQL